MAEFITGRDRMQPKALRSLKRALQPVVQDVSLTWTLPPGLEATLLSPAPTAIFWGQRLIVYAQLKGTNASKEAAGEVCLHYKLQGGDFRNTVPFCLDPKADDKLTIHRLAAKSLIQSLDENFQDAAEGKKKVVDVSLQSGVVSSHTAYIAINKELNEPIQGPLTRRDIPLIFGPLSSSALCACLCDPDDGDDGDFGESEYSNVPFASESCAPLCELDDGDDGDFGESDYSTMISARDTSPPESPLLRLISLQKADGSWELDEALASVLGVSVQSALAALPDQSKDVPRWATILAVLWMRSCSWEQREEWELLERKAVAWIQARSDSSLGECIKAANALLKSSVHPAVFGL
ncbi:von Willebrand factor A domain-containing protein 5A-like [Petaurus breviceps papuanus]|uniref:von Willebrand factor A domain-containing protein 5A-like n=1 Tax=Petaurus breviceps papuanus TaxID=3040969 RepID=UPI0036DC0422